MADTTLRRMPFCPRATSDRLRSLVGGPPLSARLRDVGFGAGDVREEFNVWDLGESTRLDRFADAFNDIFDLFRGVAFPAIAQQPSGHGSPSDDCRVRGDGRVIDDLGVTDTAIRGSGFFTRVLRVVRARPFLAPGWVLIDALLLTLSDRQFPTPNDTGLIVSPVVVAPIFHPV